MPRRLKYLVLAIGLLVVTLCISIVASAVIRHNRAAGLFDASGAEYREAGPLPIEGERVKLS
jgi:hypothetical protein